MTNMIKTLLLVMLFANSGYSTTKIVIKNAQILETNIDKFEKWGVVISDRRTINYTVIDTIYTNNDNVKINLREIIHNINITKHESGYIITFEGADLPVIKHRSPYGLKEFLININVSKLFSTQIEAQILATPKLISPMYISIRYLESFYEDYYLYEFGSYSIGLGLRANTWFGDIRIGINRGGAYLVKISPGEIGTPKGYHLHTLQGEIIMYDLSISNQLLSSNVIYTINTRYNNTRLLMNNDQNKISVLIGLSIPLGTIKNE